MSPLADSEEHAADVESNGAQQTSDGPPASLQSQSHSRQRCGTVLLHNAGARDGNEPLKEAATSRSQAEQSMQ
jgi:hypothetical protein